MPKILNPDTRAGIRATDEVARPPIDRSFKESVRRLIILGYSAGLTFPEMFGIIRDLQPYFASNDAIEYHI